MAAVLRFEPLARAGQGGAHAAAQVSVRQVFVTTLINPKGVIFAFAIFPMGAALTWFAEFGLLVSVVATGWISLGTLMARSARSLVTPMRVRRAAALGLAAFAMLFASSVLATVF